MNNYTPLKTVTVQFQCTSTQYERSCPRRCSGIAVTLWRLPSGWLRLSEEERLLQQTARFDPPQQREAGPQAERWRLGARQRAQEPWVTIQISPPNRHTLRWLLTTTVARRDGAAPPSLLLLGGWPTNPNQKERGAYGDAAGDAAWLFELCFAHDMMEGASAGTDTSVSSLTLLQLTSLP